MNETIIRKYAELMRELDLTKLEVRESDGTIRLERMSAQPRTEVVVPMPTATPVAAPEMTDPDSFSVRSPMVGVFYAAPAENAEPFVKVGDVVRKGSVMCIIEAMKLMNEIYADQDGIVTEVCVENGKTVDYGRELFRMKRIEQ